MPRRKKKPAPAKPQQAAAGTFEPAIPKDPHDVLKLFAVAVRASCAVPAEVENVSRRLKLASSPLTPPESEAAREAAKLWELFVRVARTPKDKLRLEAAKAFCRDLDTIGQRMDLPPLPRWDEIPEGLAQPGAVDAELLAAAAEGETLETVKTKARGKSKNGKNALKPKQVLALVKELSGEAREKLFVTTVGDGTIGRNDVKVLTQFMNHGGELKEKSALGECLKKLGAWLAS